MSNAFRRTSTKGFTLIELLVVIAIVSMLTSIVLASLQTARMRARDAKRLADIAQIRLALEMYLDDCTNTSGSYYPLCGVDILSGSRCTQTGQYYCSTAPGYAYPMASMPIFSDAAPSLPGGYLPTAPRDPRNESGYAYYYLRGWTKTAQNRISPGGTSADYVIGTRLEASRLNAGDRCLPTNGGSQCWNNPDINYLVGSNE